MKITIWGCRGSIATPGAATVRYGGETTCLEILTDGGQLVIVDAGSGLRKLGKKIIKEKTFTDITLLLTHSHWDHLWGFPFFIPAYLPDYTIHLCGGGDAQTSVINYLKHEMDPPYFPVDFSMLKARLLPGCQCDKIQCDGKLTGIEPSVLCHSIALNHPNGGYGFKFTNTNGSFVFLTDNEIRYAHQGGRTREDYVAFCQNAEILIHDAQYTESEYKITRGWGHSTYQDALDLAMEAGVKRLGLFHHDPDRTDEDLDRQLDWCREYIAGKGIPLECFACAEGLNLEL